ncbi:expansin (peptidoglycan-binding protein) [Actinoplanes lutulentus]|uniref:expansin EXLX1 family cellulose-binding protein n=1 Tax=Actinoplanes lutulentus TaxID=1287878 RepID=UPI0015EB40ED|nr:expansin EXLX1 family cellulose-binding protein [Actinoplanes lutulentus]MBB2947955.1 expansin (peptidoglycan-binding protein) [Actinoplanes lutulentus]
MSAHRNPFSIRWLAAGGAAVIAGIIGVALVLQTGGSACAAPPSTTAKTGKATFYDLAGTSGNCSFEVPADDLYVALGPSQYSEGTSCGAYLDVTGPKGKVRVKVFDSCPECAAGHLDLSRTAFKKIGAEIDGIIPIKYKLVTNPSVPGPISVRIKEGASQYWFAARIDNHANLLSSVKVASGSGSFKSAHRTDFNYWLIDSGAGPGPFKIKITDVYGKTSTVSGIKMNPGSVQKTSVRASSASSSGTAAKVESTTSASKKPTVTAKASPSKPAAAKSSASASASAAVSPSATTAAAAPLLESTTTAEEAEAALAGPAVDLAAAEPRC